MAYTPFPYTKMWPPCVSNWVTDLKRLLFLYPLIFLIIHRIYRPWLSIQSNNAVNADHRIALGIGGLDIEFGSALNIWTAQKTSASYSRFLGGWVGVPDFRKNCAGCSRPQKPGILTENVYSYSKIRRSQCAWTRAQVREKVNRFFLIPGFWGREQKGQSSRLFHNVEIWLDRSRKGLKPFFWA
jgi:hypothetical protein